MARARFSILLMLLLPPSTARADIAPPAARTGAQTIKVEALLVDVGASGALCGVEDRVAAMRYRVVRVLDGKLEGDDLWAGHHCPEMTRRQYGGAAAGDLDRFVAGDVHLLTLAPGKVPIERAIAFRVIRADRFPISPESDRCPILSTLGEGFLHANSDGCPDVIIAYEKGYARGRALLDQLLVELERHPRLTRLAIRGEEVSVVWARSYLTGRGIPREHLEMRFDEKATGASIEPLEWDGKRLEYR